jgi:hypothetical protein
LGRLRGAEQRLQDVRAAVLRFAARRPPEYGRVLAQVTHTLAAARAFGGQLDAACRTFGEAYALWDRAGDVGGMAGSLTMGALLRLRLRPDEAEVARGQLQFVYCRLGERHDHREIARGHAARDLAWVRRQAAPEDELVDRLLDRAFDHLAAAPTPSRWEVGMTHLEVGRVWLDRQRVRTATGERCAADALVRAEGALAAARRALPPEVDLLSRLKLEAACADLRYRRGEEERALALARTALDVARRNGLGLPALDLEQLVRRMERPSA